MPSPAKSTPATTPKVLREDLPLALDVLSDLFLHSTFVEDEIERERGVILSEISESEDTPDDHIHVVFDRAFWPGQPAVATDHRQPRRPCPACGGSTSSSS